VNTFFFSIYLILALRPGIYSASNRNEYQKQKNNVSGNTQIKQWEERPFIVILAAGSNVP
jgi:hypothetical protein